MRRHRSLFKHRTEFCLGVSSAVPSCFGGAKSRLPQMAFVPTVGECPHRGFRKPPGPARDVSALALGLPRGYLQVPSSVGPTKLSGPGGSAGESHGSPTMALRSMSSGPPCQSIICPWHDFQILLPQDSPSRPCTWVHAVPWAWASLSSPAGRFTSRVTSL